MACIEEQVDVPALLAGELIDRRGREARLPQTLHVLGFLAETGVAQLAGQPVALGDERRRLERIEAIELGVEIVHVATWTGASARTRIAAGDPCASVTTLTRR